MGLNGDREEGEEGAVQARRGEDYILGMAQALTPDPNSISTSPFTSYVTLGKQLTISKLQFEK